MKCRATSKRTGQPCGANAIRGRTLCYHHGGRSLSGVANPAFKHGRYSKHLPARLLETYQAALQDPDLLALRDELALLDARLNDLLAKLDRGGSAQTWQQLGEALASARAAWEQEDQTALGQALDAMASLASNVADEAPVWAEIQQTVALRVRVADSEQRRLMAAQQMIPAEQAMTLIAAIIDTVRRHVVDRGALAAISADVGRLLGPAVPSGHPAAGANQ